MITTKVDPVCRQAIQVRAFRFAEWYGEIDRDLPWRDLQQMIAHLVDPGSATETVHWGRNYLYRARLEVGCSADTTSANKAAGDEAAARIGTVEAYDVVVKQFRNKGARKRIERSTRGSKAARSWKMALNFCAAGVATARPVAWIESTEPDGPSFFICRHLPDRLEARYVLRAINGGTVAVEYPDLSVDEFFVALGQALRHMHRAGLFHRDLSIGNVLFPEVLGSVQWQDLVIIDLNRARLKRRLSLKLRCRDLCRLKIDHEEHQRQLLSAYWQRSPSDVEWSAYQLYRRGFLWKIGGKQKVRAPFKRIGVWLKPRRAHVHIPVAPKGAGSREKIVWDHLSDQPHQHASRFEKLRVRAADAPSHLHHLALFGAKAPAIWRRYRQLEHEVRGTANPPAPVPWSGVGVCVRPWPEAPEALLACLDESRVRRVLLRLHPWQHNHDAEAALARAIHERGLDLVYSLPQNRELVHQPDLWRQRIAELAERFVPYGTVFQVGQAINRSKWGIWRYGEYLELARIAALELRRYPGVSLMGPAVIDFELHATAAVVNHADCPPLDILASLLYVDRRGAPENAQLGFDSIGKSLLCQAIADTSRACGPRSWITEINWPLREGPYSPAGKSVAVDEDTQADYLARFYLQTLAVGAVERVYWWQMVARGYGLVTPRNALDPSDLRRRPSFEALRTLETLLADTECLGRQPASNGCWLLRFRHSETEEETWVGWCVSGTNSVELPSPPQKVISQRGEPLTVPHGSRVDLTKSVRFFCI